MSNTHPTGSPDWHSFHFLFFLSWLLIVVPFMIVVVILVWKRRKSFPLANRAPLLIWQATLLLVSTVLCGLPQLFWPEGLPCSLLFILLYVLSVPQAVIYLSKGWIFTLRIEILEYLDELNWRDEKRSKLMELVEKRREKLSKLQATSAIKQLRSSTDGQSNPTRLPVLSEVRHQATSVVIDIQPAPVATNLKSSSSPTLTSSSTAAVHPYLNQIKIGAANNGGGTSGDAAVDEDLAKLESLLESATALCNADRSTLPGHFFIQHRRWSDFQFIKKIYVLFAIFFTIGFLLVCAFDVDPMLTKDLLRRNGVTNPSDVGVDEGNQFLGDAILDSPVCLVWSFKINVFCALMFIAAGPCGGWIVWRLLKFRSRQAIRMRERRELEALKKQYADKRDIGSGASNHSTPTVTGHQLDDIHEMQIEFVAAISVIGCWVGLYYLTQFYRPEWYMILFLFLLLSVMYWSSVRPLMHSYAISRLYRCRLQAGQGVKSVSGSSSPNGGAGENDQKMIPHHAKYYDLDYILHTPHTYAVLLAFLRKEYSSENALFLQEVRTFLTGRHTHLHGHHLHAHNHMGGVTSKSFVTGMDDNNVRETSMSLSCLSTTSSPIDQHAQALELKAFALKVYEQYLAPRSAIYEVNLPADLSTDLQAKIDELRQWTPNLDAHTNSSDGTGLDLDPIGGNGGASSPQRAHRHAHNPRDLMSIDSPRERIGSIDLPSLQPPSPPPFQLSTLYQSAFKEIFLLLVRDSFTRFVLTREFACLLQQADEDELNRLEQQGDVGAETQAVIEEAIHRTQISMSTAPIGSTNHASVQPTQVRLGRKSSIEQENDQEEEV